MNILTRNYYNESAGNKANPLKSSNYNTYKKTAHSMSN